MIVSRDSETGALGLPTPEQAAELQRALADEKAGEASEVPVVTQRPDGVLRMRVPSSLHTFSVVRIDADGERRMDCLQGEAAADNAVRQPHAGSSRGLEVR
jgi:hypothetical protein